MEQASKQQGLHSARPWSNQLAYELIRENRSILSSLGEAEEKLADLKCELDIAADGRLELVIKLADAYEEIKRLGINLVSSQNEVRQLTTDLNSSEATASSIELPMEHLPRLFESSSEAFILLEGEQVTHCNEAAARLLGVTDLSRIHGHTLSDLSPAEQPGGKLSKDLGKEYVTKACQTGKLNFDWLFCRQDNQQEIATEIVLTALPFGGTSVLLVSARDATERQQHAQKMEGLAFFDALTGLPNRRLLLDRLAQAMTQSQRSGHCGALVFLDLDHFKRLNDQHGHACGDEVLRQTAALIRQCVRAEDTVSRQGGDEFVVLMVKLDEDPGMAHSHAEQVAEKIRKVLEKPYTLPLGGTAPQDQEVQFSCSASLGVTLFKGSQAKVESILKTADSAMYRAKSAGGNRIEFSQDNVLRANVDPPPAL